MGGVKSRKAREVMLKVKGFAASGAVRLLVQVVEFHVSLMTRANVRFKKMTLGVPLSACPAMVRALTWKKKKKCLN